ncbi:MAG: hypothetical protein JXQ73_00980 [Phycisphaerae bacterium]|nr:hypothetical protein [Phycisphaerae bacterium]
MSKKKPKSSSRAVGRRSVSGKIPTAGHLDWDDSIPVPYEYHLKCEGCGQDLTGLDRRICPECGRRFHLPIPPDLNLTCAECGYNLTGLTKRVCPECGTGFDVRGLRFAKRMQGRNQLRKRIPSYDLIEYLIASVLVGFGFVVTFLRGPLFCFALVLGPGVAIASYRANLEWPRIALTVGIWWAIVGVMTLVFT